MIDGILSLFSSLNPTTNYQFTCYLILLGFIAYTLKEPLILLIKRKKGCDDEKQGDSSYAPASFITETDRRLSKVEVTAENNTLKLQNMSLDQALDRKDIVQTQKDIETMSIKLDGHFSQSREVMVNLTNRFEENTKSMEDHKKFMQNVLDLMKEKNSNGN